MTEKICKENHWPFPVTMGRPVERTFWNALPRSVNGSRSQSFSAHSRRATREEETFIRDLKTHRKYEDNPCAAE